MAVVEVGQEPTGSAGERSGLDHRRSGLDRDQAGLEEEDFEVIGFHEFAPSAEEVVAARHFVRETLEGRGDVPGHVIDGAELAVDEFSVNAVRHAGTFFAVSVAVGPGAVKVAVRDDSDVFPHIRDHTLLSMAGRGLSIVASTVEQWGATSLGHGKEVWAELR